MGPYAYRENLESVLEFTGGKHMLTMVEAALYLGLRDYRTVKTRCPKTFANGWGTAETFAKELCETKGGKRK